MIQTLALFRTAWQARAALRPCLAGFRILPADLRRLCLRHPRTIGFASAIVADLHALHHPARITPQDLARTTRHALALAVPMPDPARAPAVTAICTRTAPVARLLEATEGEYAARDLGRASLIGTAEAGGRILATRLWTPVLADAQAWLAESPGR